MQKIKLELKDILSRLGKLRLDSDFVVAVGRGGIIPAGLVARKLECDIAVIWLRQYTDGMPPKKLYDSPKLVKPFTANVSGKKVLVVDDFSRSGNTLEVARNILLKAGAKVVKTMAIAGRKADYCLFETDDCAEWPWT